MRIKDDISKKRDVSLIFIIIMCHNGQRVGP
jgi:hypothetical protein